MTAAPDAVAEFEAYLARHESKHLLRFLTCGSVDDGKSTLIGRLLYDTKLLFDDQLAALSNDTARHGSAGGGLDFALLVDGLEAEREQGITIDVAYRFFSTDKRKFIVADTPGHEQYTRNMATGASTADLAVILVDARKGILQQTKRHSFIASLLGIRHLVLAVNKIDLVGFSKEVFDDIVADYRAFASDLGFETLVPIPVSARDGDNVVERGDRLDWFEGPSLLDHLETVDIGSRAGAALFRMPVQWVNRPSADFRGYSGTIVSGTVRVGDPVCLPTSGLTSTVASITMGEASLDSGREGQAVTLTLSDEIDVSRGDVLAAVEDRPEIADQFAARILWMHEKALVAGRTYVLKIGTKSVNASVTAIKHRIDVTTFQHIAARKIEMNEVASVNISAFEPIVCEPYARTRALGSFILIDRLSNATVGFGIVDFALRRATNINWQAVHVTKEVRAALKGQKPRLLWFTGLSGAGKSTIASLVEQRLVSQGLHTYLLDGDNVRHGLNRDLGFTEADRVENIRRVAETAKLMLDAGLVVLASFISPFRSERQMVRELFGEGEFLEIFVDAPLAIAEERDPKGLYKKARRGEISNFTGLTSPYEPPLDPDLRLQTDLHDLEHCVAQVLRIFDRT